MIAARQQTWFLWNCCRSAVSQTLASPATTSSTNTSPQLMRCSSQVRPWSPHSVPTIFTTMPDGWYGPSDSCVSRQLVWPQRHDDGGQNRQRRALHTLGGTAHQALHRCPLILSIGACAALPESVRGGGHGERVVCAAIRHIAFFLASSYRCTNTCPTNGILGIVRKL